MTGFAEGPVVTLRAGAAIGAHVLVKYVSNVLALADTGEEWVGATERACFAAGELVPVRLRNAEGAIKCKAVGAFAQGAVVYGQDLGLVDDVSGSNVRVGIALEAATAANDIVQILPC